MTSGRTEYLLQARPPVRAFVIAAVVTLIGAIMVVVSLQNSWHVAFTVLFALLIVGGIGLALAGARSMKSHQVRVVFDDDGYQITGRDASRDGRWAEVTKVTQTDDGHHVTIYHGTVTRTHLLCPLGLDDPQLQRLITDMAARLDHSRGYRPL